jgi:hypothetical protein
VIISALQTQGHAGEGSASASQVCHVHFHRMTQARTREPQVLRMCECMCVAGHQVDSSKRGTLIDMHWATEIFGTSSPSSSRCTHRRAATVLTGESISMRVVASSVLLFLLSLVVRQPGASTRGSGGGGQQVRVCVVCICARVCDGKFVGEVLRSLAGSARLDFMPVCLCVSTCVGAAAAEVGGCLWRP